MKIFRSMAALALVLGFAACAAPAGRVADGADLAKAQQSITAGGQLDLSLVRVLRLDIDGRSVEAISLLPTTLTTADSGASTVIGFTADKSRIVFVTKTAENAGRVLDLAWDDIQTGDHFVFPIALEQGVVQAEVRVRTKVQRPADQ
jgi:hypothetical protein